uniref:hypothetical protein n=1 Tax=Roseivirga sp. TaxID=1964215 RepID=UPI004047496E
MIDTFNEHYWTERYANNQIGWDIGHVSTPLRSFTVILIRLWRIGSKPQQILT